MFSYYGSKSIIVNLYPKPMHDRIIEPFAGSARYALRFFEKDVLLVDKYEVVVRVWKWLQQCSPGDILGLPKLTEGLDIRTLNISEDEKLFLGLNAGVASTTPRYTVSAFAGNQNGRVNKMRNIANSLYKIKHWEIRHDSYENVANETATWFVDPPYQVGGHAYKERDIDYTNLQKWCGNRNGQLIVCENTKADWLPFKPLSRMRGANGRHTTEAIYTNYHTHFNNEQGDLFKHLQSA